MTREEVLTLIRDVVIEATANTPMWDRDGAGVVDDFAKQLVDICEREIREENPELAEIHRLREENERLRRGW